MREKLSFILDALHVLWFQLVFRLVEVARLWNY